MSEWIVEVGQAGSTPRARIVAVPWAGGGASVYRPWASWLPRDIALDVVRLPGRENRLRETPLTDMRTLITLAALAASVAAIAVAAPVRYQLPEETVALAPGPNRDLAVANCSACHSADYIGTQPRGLRDPAALWSMEVTKLRRVYAAPIEDANVKPIVDYLVAAYGK